MRAGVGVVASIAGLAVGVPREQMSFSGVASWGEAGDVHNVLADRTLIGGYGVGSVRVSAMLTKVAPGTFASDSRVYLTAPNSQGSLVIQPFAVDAFSGSLSVSNLGIGAPEAWAASTGLWRVRFYEAFADSATGPDAIWDSISITLDDEPLEPPATLVSIAGEYHEVEENSSKQRANRIEGIAPGERLVGVSTGAIGSGAGEATADYFRVTTGPAAAGVYRHRLVLTSATPGHALSLRGLTQSGGFIAPGSEAALQIASDSTQPSRFVQWYGFGQQERMVVRVSGHAGTTEPYAAAYMVDAITPPNLGAFAGGITISTDGLSNVDTDLWLYDSQFHAMPGAGNDDGVPGSNSPRQSVLVRMLPAGTYYLALSDYNLANDQSSPPDDLSRSGPVLEHAGAVVNGSASSGLSLAFSVRDSRGRLVVTPASKAGAFDVAFYRFEILEFCVADRTGPLGPPDGAVTIEDLLDFLVAFESGTASADVDDGHGGGGPDGAVTIDDLLYFLARFEGGC
jgi:hypothetical protein